ncbi:PD-(D/E)XK nuclease family protein [Natronosalvus rutilus]|uniref:PD-(D/E)XK nuclease family protein n=1 Tax=Natronosalvus rutilus TaxID=2953753 RepID=A0A9E7SWX5_9EURY|nr:PD-(D/E)XK nuclease family protein [Natronosalvus rutilus]UTF55572.1 PD-(D/E)XK nuclease family protein [Natronosalvus rutilus]
MTLEDLTRRLDDMGRRLDRLPETEEPPPTTLQLLNRSRQEGDWQQLLAYFLDPDAPHRLDHAALEQFLRGLRNRDDVHFELSRFDLENIQVATEVPIPDGRIDLLLWCEEKWFILCELKIDASEGDGQTMKYAAAETFQNVDLDPTAITEPRQHYLFITPDGSPPESDAFTAVEWSWIASQLRAVLDSDYGSYPVRTTSQLDDFVDTIETELTMTEHEQNEAAKAELYVDYYDELAEVTSAFQTEWDDLIDNWGRRLAATLDAARLVEDPEGVPSVPEEDVLLELPDGEDRHRYWLCRQANGNWSWLFPTDWWTHLERDEPVYRNEKPNARVGFLHRPSSDRETVLENHELTFYLRNAPSGNDDFYPGFAQRFNADDEILAALPDRTERRGRKSNALEATYEIDLDEHGDLFAGYVAALATAVDEHIVSNHDLVERIDELYQETREEDL